MLLVNVLFQLIEPYDRLALVGKVFYLEVTAGVPAGWDAASFVLRGPSGVVFVQLLWLRLTLDMLQGSSFGEYFRDPACNRVR